MQLSSTFINLKFSRVLANNSRATLVQLLFSFDLDMRVKKTHANLLRSRNVGVFLSRFTSSLAERDVLLLKSISLVIYICQVGCLATINFSFGFFLAIFTVPAFLFVRSTQNRYAI